MISHDYSVRVNDFDVILGNAALLKCEIPSFVSDFVSVINWSDNNGVEFYDSTAQLGIIKNGGHTNKLRFHNFLFCFYNFFPPPPVVSQDFSTQANDVYVIIGNSALVKCEIPSFVADFVYVYSWVDEQGQDYFASNSNGIFTRITFLWTHNFAFQLFLNLTNLARMKCTSFWAIRHWSNVTFLALLLILYR